MFKSFKSVRTTRLSIPVLPKRRRVRESSILFKDSKGARVLSLYGVGDLRRGKGNSYTATCWKQNKDRYAVRVFDASQSIVATYIGSSSSSGAGDTIINLHNAISGSPYIRSVFHNETINTISNSLSFADGIKFSKGKG